MLGPTLPPGHAAISVDERTGLESTAVFLTLTLTLTLLCIGVTVIRTGQFKLDPSHWRVTSHLDHPTQPTPTKWTLRGWPTVEGGVVRSRALRNPSLSMG